MKEGLLSSHYHLTSGSTASHVHTKPPKNKNYSTSTNYMSGDVLIKNIIFNRIFKIDIHVKHVERKKRIKIPI